MAITFCFDVVIAARLSGLRFVGKLLGMNRMPEEDYIILNYTTCLDLPSINCIISDMVT